MKQVILLTPDDIGKWVIYKPEMENERGKIKSFNNTLKIAFVVYKCNDNWNGEQWKNYTAQATSYEDLYT